MHSDTTEMMDTAKPLPAIARVRVPETQKEQKIEEGGRLAA